MTSLDLRFTLDDLFPDFGPEPARESYVLRYLDENWRRLQPLAALATQDEVPEVVEAGEFADPPQFDYEFEMPERQQRAFRRTSWIIARANEAYRVHLFSRPAHRCYWDDEPHWDLRTPSLIDVMGDQLIYALSVMYAEACDSGYEAVRRVLKRLAEVAAALNQTGLLGLIEATLGRLESRLSSITRWIADLPRRVLSPGGQTARFVPLA